jgi:hypothetical protein
MGGPPCHGLDSAGGAAAAGVWPGGDGLLSCQPAPSPAIPCRAVADDVLPPSFIQRVDGPPGSLHAELRSKCGAHVGAKHIGERLQRCWGSGAGFKLDETKGSIRSMLQVGGREWVGGCVGGWAGGRAKGRKGERGQHAAGALAWSDVAPDGASRARVCAMSAGHQFAGGHALPGQGQAAPKLHLTAPTPPTSPTPPTRRSMPPAATRAKCGACCETWRSPSSTTNSSSRWVGAGLCCWPGSGCWLGLLG